MLVRWNHRKTSEYARARVIIFSSVQFLSKIIIKLNFFQKKPKPVQTDRFRFDYFRAKAETQPIGSVFLIWLGFSGLARLLISVRFDFLVSGL
jgi:hypothetical protein